MKLTAEEIKKIDSALEALKQSLKDEIENTPGITEHFVVEDASLKQIADGYLSAKGILSLLVDSDFLGVRRVPSPTRCGGACHCSCVQPSKGAVTW